MIDTKEFWCEFEKIDQDGRFCGIEPTSKYWKDACRRYATRQWHFENLTTHLCTQHYEVLQKWIREDGL